MYFNRIIFFVLIIVISVNYIHGFADVDYRDCANKEIKSLRIEPCVKTPCNFKVGDQVTIYVDFVANHNTSKVSLEGTLSTGGFFNYQINIPGFDTRACGSESPKLKCPLIAGESYTFGYKGVVPLSSRFNIFRYATWKLVGENHKTLTCAEIPIQK